MTRDRLQRCKHHVPGLRSAPWSDPAQFPIVTALEANAAAIHEEFQDLVVSGSLRLHPQSHGGPRRQLTTGDWNIVEAWSYSRLNERTAIQAPLTSSVLLAEPDGPCSRTSRRSRRTCTPDSNTWARRNNRSRNIEQPSAPDGDGDTGDNEG